VQITPKPAREGGPQIFLGGSVEPAIRRAGRVADGYIRTRGGRIDSMQQDLKLAEDAARAAGRDPGRLEFAQLQNTFVWEGEGAWEVVREGATHQIGVYGGWAEGSDTPGKGFSLGAGAEERARYLTPTGTPLEVIHALRPMVEAFADRRVFHLIVRLHYPGMDFRTAGRAMELFASKVLPALKGS
jgi:alkanesulfonate monooxygenase SsuD/methylene tetrahydromethanopterin reductase-like flavin-dependent oxidoreductase (luciferase family)